MNSKDESTLFKKITSGKINRLFLNIIFSSALLISIFMSILSYKEVTNLVKANALVVHTYEVLSTIDIGLYMFSQLESNQRAFLITNEKRFLDEGEELKNFLKKNIENLKYLTRDNAEQRIRIDVFQKMIEQRIVLLADIIYLKNTNQLNTPKGLLAFSRSNETSTQVKNLAQEIKSVEKVLLEERDRISNHETFFSSCLVLIGSFLSISFLIIFFILVSVELTNRKKFENQEKKNRSFLRQIIESTSDMIAAIDNSKQFKIFNETYFSAFRRLFGKSLSQNMELEKLEHEISEDKLSQFHTWKESLNPNNPPKIMEFEHSNGTMFYELSSYEIYDEDHAIRGKVHCMRDITVRLQEHNKLQESYEKQALGIQELQMKNEQITLMVEMSDIMLAANSQEELSSIMAKYAQRLLGFGSGYLFMMHPSKNYLEQVGTWGIPTVQEKIMTPEQCWAIRLGRIHIINHNSQELMCYHIHEKEVSNMEGSMCLPLMAQNDIYGMLYVEFSEAFAFESADKKLLITAFAELTALAMANVRLRENLRHQSIRDPLTGLYNRRYLEDALTREIHQSSRANAEFSLLMLDLDHFKKINDTFGHDAGDVALKEVGNIMKNSIRMGDIASRYGGEEFIIVFHDMNLEKAKSKAEELKAAISKVHVRYGAQDIGSITISIGIAMYPSDSKEMSTLIELADKALYHAKNNGRNTISVYSEIT